MVCTESYSVIVTKLLSLTMLLLLTTEEKLMVVEICNKISPMILTSFQTAAIIIPITLTMA